MRQIAFTFFLISTAICCATAQDNLTVLLTELDKVLAAENSYMQQKEQRIERLKNLLEMESIPEKQFELTSSIIEEFKSYQSDSAFYYVDRNIRLAEQHNNMNWLIRTKLQYSFILSSSGLFEESTNIMGSIPAELLTEDIKVDYYKRIEHLYLNFNIYQQHDRFTGKYISLLQQARDSILAYLPAESAERWHYKAIQAREAGDLSTAAEYSEKYLQSLQPGTHEYAKRCYNYYGIRKRMGEGNTYISYLVNAAISDVQDAIKDTNALGELATWVFGKGDIKHAYQYIQYSLQDANFYNARYRLFRISQALPIITDAYEYQSIQQQRWMLTLLIITTILLIVIFITCLLLVKRASALRLARHKLKETNEHLEEVNKQLNALNQDLTEANRIKEEYIGYFLDLCSEYIGRLEDYRKMIHNRLAAKRYDELLKITSAARSSSTAESKDLYANFDKAFLKIYTGFVPAFNALLKAEERFEVGKDELMNTELRIFALIRMGITDSTKIATFLHCSIQTVYNYRSKIKRKCLDEQIDIEACIKQIGSIRAIHPGAITS